MTTSDLRADTHSVEPIPDSDRDSTGPQQMWIWAGANIAPINWALGALGIVLKLGLCETIAVIEIVVMLTVIAVALFGSQALSERAFRLLRWFRNPPGAEGQDQNSLP